MSEVTHLLTQAGPEIDWESPMEKINILFCFLPSAALSILVLKCSRTAAPKYFPDKLPASFVTKPAVCDGLQMSKNPVRFGCGRCSQRKE